MLSINNLKKELENLKYYATDEIVYEAFNALSIFEKAEVNPGQDIYAICLEGPPGAGKTEFAKVYTKLAAKLLNSDVSMVDYQCDQTTGKSELFEDINISAAIAHDPEHVNIPGKLVDAIKKVNEGKKVVLFIDEYDKAREETDSFLLQFLQSGKINATQHGDMEIKDEYKGNLQVFLCKNDAREELSGPLSRRIRILRLDYMLPEIFYKVANRVLIEDADEKVSESLINLISIMYKKAYDDRELYNRLPSASEMLIAIEDANRLTKYAKAPEFIIYKTIIKNMFKSVDDIVTFEGSLNRTNDEKEQELKNVIDNMKSSESTLSTQGLNSLIAEKILSSETEILLSKKKEMEDLIIEYKNIFMELEQKRRDVVEGEIEDYHVLNGQLKLAHDPVSIIPSFNDDSIYIKRGKSVFGNVKSNWIDIASVDTLGVSHHFLIDEIKKNISSLNITIYEDGLLIYEDEYSKVIVIKETNNGEEKYRILSNNTVNNGQTLNEIISFVSLLEQVKEIQTSIPIKLNPSNNKVNISMLVYSENDLPYEKQSENIYSIEIEVDTTDIERTLKIPYTPNDLSNSSSISKKLIKGINR